MDDMRLGVAIRTLRIRRGWRQIDLATAAGVTRATVAKVEHSRADDVQLKRTRAICRPSICGSTSCHDGAAAISTAC